MRRIATLILLAGCVILAGATRARAQGNSPGLAQVVALDECDPTTFNAALGPDFCKNVTLGASTTLSNLLALAEAGTPDPGWDFEPDTVAISKRDILSVVDQGGEPHTFTEVKAFGNGFVPPLNPGGATSVIPECAGGFSTVAVAKTRILQGSHLDITGLSEGKTSLPMLHPSLDAHGSRREVNRGQHPRAAPPLLADAPNRYARAGQARRACAAVSISEAGTKRPLQGSGSSFIVLRGFSFFEPHTVNDERRAETR